jgi:hypothetical protein
MISIRCGLDGEHTPESDIDGDTTLTLSLELVQNPGILERTLSKFVGFLERGLVRIFAKPEQTKNMASQTYLLELFNGTSVNTTALVDQVT